MSRVLVVGGGLAGGQAALAARDAGAEVTLVARGPGASALCAGVIEVAATPRGAALARALAPPAELAQALADRFPGHPYGVLGHRLEVLPEALAFLRRSLAPLFGGGGGDGEPGWFATQLGEIRSAAFAQASQAGGALRSDRRVAVAHFRYQPALVAGELIAAALAEAGFRAAALPLDWLDREERLSWSPFELAGLLDDPGEATRLGEAVRRARPEADVVLLPALVGLSHADASLRRVAEAAGVPCAELLAGLPSVPGLRLQQALDGALSSAGVVRLSGDAVALQAGRARVRVEAGEQEIPFDAAVLASGRFLGGGVRREASFAEPLCGLPVWDGAAELNGQPRESVLGDEPGQAAPAFRAGVRFDGELRPLDGRGEVVPWLRVAGAVLGGADAAIDGAGLGLAAFTGFLAGRLAAGSAT